MKKIAVITGASSGIGKQFVLDLDTTGYDEIWAIARNQKALDELALQVNIPVKTLSLDLTKEESFEEYAKELEEEKPVIKLLINASGFGIFKSVEDMEMNDVDGMIDLNCKA